MNSWALKHLERYGLVKKEPLSSLPIELWAMILEDALRVPYVFDTTIQSSEHFGRFRGIWIHGPLSPYLQHYFDSEPTYKRLRLVCRTWEELLRDKRKVWYFSYSCGDIPHNVKRLDLSGSHDAFGSTQRLHDYLMSDGNLHCLVSITMRTPEWRFSTAHPIDILFLAAPSLTGVRAFRFVVGKRYKHKDLLQRVQIAFPRLTALSLSVEKLPGAIHLPNLEVLDLTVGEASLELWDLPALRHLSIDIIGDHLPPIQDFVLRHSQLESLLLFDSDHRLIITDEFWDKFPQLQHLGINLCYLDIMSTPPANHPFSQLSHLHEFHNHPVERFYGEDTKDAAGKDPVNLMQSHVMKLTELKCITMQWYQMRCANIPPGHVWYQLLKLCSEKGITFRNHHGAAISVEAPKGPFWSK